MSTIPKILISIAGLLVTGFVLTRLGVFGGKRPDNLGLHNKRLAPCPESPNCVSTYAQDTQHRMEPIPITSSPQEARQRLLNIIQQRPRTKVITVDDDYIYVEFRTSTMRFVDDVEFYIDTQSQLIHFRSASRLGYSDLGLNRKRMHEIRTAFLKAG